MSPSDAVVSRNELERQLSDLGVCADMTLVVHTSFRAVRQVEDGPFGVIEALRAVLGPEGMLVMPSIGGPLPYATAGRGVSCDECPAAWDSIRRRR